jgi:hypothetical protein
LQSRDGPYNLGTIPNPEERVGDLALNEQAVKEQHFTLSEPVVHASPLLEIVAADPKTS